MRYSQKTPPPLLELKPSAFLNVKWVKEIGGLWSWDQVIDLNAKLSNLDLLKL